MFYCCIGTNSLWYMNELNIHGKNCFGNIQNIYVFKLKSDASSWYCALRIRLANLIVI